MLLKNILHSISDTYCFTNKPKVIFLNTGDILSGKILHSNYSDSNYLPGQAKKQIANDDILFSEIRPANQRFALVKVDNPTDYVVSTKLMVLRCFNPNYDVRYVYDYLTQPCILNRLQKLAESRSGTFPQITFSEIENLEIPDITLSEQQHIVDILGSIDEKIENNDAITRRLESLATNKYIQLAYKCEDFIKLNLVIELYDYKRVPLSSREREFRQGTYPYYGATGILDYVNNYLFSGEYVLVAEDGTVIDNDGHPIVQLVNGDFWVNNHAHILQAKNGYTNYSLYIALKNLSVAKAVTGAVQLKINQGNLCAMELPNLENNLSSFNSEIGPIFKKLLHIRNENANLNALKAQYLKKFFG